VEKLFRDAKIYQIYEGASVRAGPIAQCATLGMRGTVVSEPAFHTFAPQAPVRSSASSSRATS
jgi:hypothetical protein